MDTVFKPEEDLEIKPSEELKESLDELKDMETHPESYKKYNSADELLKDILKDEYYRQLIKKHSLNECSQNRLHLLNALRHNYII